MTSFIQKISFTFICLAQVSALSMTMDEAFDLLQRSDRWKLTETLNPEAKEKTEAVLSSFRPKTDLVFRQFVARTNPITYGVTPGETAITTIGFGTTALEASWTIMDPLEHANLLLARSREHLTTDECLQYQLDLTAGMLLQYLTVQKLQRQFALSQATLEKSELILKLASAKHSVGAGIPLEVARARNLVSVDRIKKMSVYTKYLKAKHDLALLLGLEKLDGKFEAIDSKEIEVGDVQAVLESALNSRPDLKSSRGAVDAAHDAVHESHRLLFPKVQVVAEAGSTDITPLGLPGQTLNGFFGINVSIPLDSGGLIESKRHESETMLIKSEIGLREKINEITAQVKEALENLSIASEALKAAHAYVQTAAEEAAISDRRFESGTSSGIEVSNAHTSLANAKDNENESQFNYEAAKIAYYRAMGSFKTYFVGGAK